MSYGHGPHLARSAQQHSAQQTPPPGPPPQSRTPATPDTLAPDWYTAPELAPILTGRDIRGLYRWLNQAGVPQRRIAALTATSQPQVADIISGRRARVRVYDVLARITEGLGVPRERMGLSFWDLMAPGTAPPTPTLEGSRSPTPGRGRTPPCSAAT